MKLRQQLQAAVVRQLMTVLLSADSDRNFELSPAEVDQLVQRLDALSDLVEFSEDNFRALLAQDEGTSLTITDVCNLVRTFHEDLVDKEKAIFTFKRFTSSSRQ